MITALLFLEDGTTYSGIDGSIRVFFDLQDEPEDEDYKEVSIRDLLKQLLERKELLPLEIRKILQPIEELEL